MAMSASITSIHNTLSLSLKLEPVPFTSCSSTLLQLPLGLFRSRQGLQILPVFERALMESCKPNPSCKTSGCSHCALLSRSAWVFDLSPTLRNGFFLLVLTCLYIFLKSRKNKLFSPTSISACVNFVSYLICQLCP